MRAHPEWRRSRARRLFADAATCALARRPRLRRQRAGREPRGHVSWFAARAYCAARGHGCRPSTSGSTWPPPTSARRRHARPRLPGPAARLVLAADARALAPVRSTFRDVYGIWDMHGLVWEWTSDFSRRWSAASRAPTARSTVRSTAAAAPPRGRFPRLRRVHAVRVPQQPLGALLRREPRLSRGRAGRAGRRGRGWGSARDARARLVRLALWPSWPRPAAPARRTAPRHRGGALPAGRVAGESLDAFDSRSPTSPAAP